MNVRILFMITLICANLFNGIGEGLIHAETMTKLLFDSDYSTLRADGVIDALNGDPRLILIDEHDAFQTPLPKLVAKHGLVASNCGYYFNSLILNLTIPSRS